jgi:hypothetical protein
MILGERRRECLVLLVATAIAVGSALPAARSSNDGSRLATIEALVDYRTFAIDDSIYVPPRSFNTPGRPDVYDPSVPELDQRGTGDKMLINGRFYSDKPAVPAIFLAGLYALLQGAFGLRAADRPDVFCYLMTLASSGLAYVVAVWCIYRLASALRLDATWQLALTASFALATMALPYVRQINGHILLLTAAAGTFLALVRGAERPAAWLWGVIGGLVGFAYAVEQPTGGLLAAGACLVAAWRAAHAQKEPSFSWRAGLLAAALVVAGALPWALFHHGVTYAYTGKWSPPGADPAVFDYPGSEFVAKDLTGAYNHDDVVSLFLYSLAILVSERGFLLHNLPLFLAVCALLVLPPHLRRCPEVLLAAGWSIGTWLVFAVLSTNFAGWCMSIRWFLPLLAPGYFLLALLVRERPRLRSDFLILSGWGAVVGAMMWSVGPWFGIMEQFWPVQAAALATWLGVGRNFPTFVDRLARHLGPLLGLALIGTALVVLLAPEPPFELPPPYNSEWAIAVRALGWVAIGLALGAWARGQRWPWLVLGLTLAVGEAFVAVRPWPTVRELAWLVLGLAALAVLPAAVIRARSTAATSAARNQ